MCDNLKENAPTAQRPTSYEQPTKTTYYPKNEKKIYNQRLHEDRMKTVKRDRALPKITTLKLILKLAVSLSIHN